MDVDNATTKRPPMSAALASQPRHNISHSPSNPSSRPETVYEYVCLRACVYQIGWHGGAGTFSLFHHWSL
jgi:hypothetical protein